MARNSGAGRTELSWMPAGQPVGQFRVQYRKRGSVGDWAAEQSERSSYTLTGLEEGAEYEYRIGTVCGGATGSALQDNGGDGAYSYTAVQYFATGARGGQNGSYQCGTMPVVDIANRRPLQVQLVANEVFMAGDFPVTVIQAEGNSGSYSGTGYIQVPYLADTRLKVTFSNIQLNTDRKLIGGVVETTYDIEETNVVRAREVVKLLEDIVGLIGDGIDKLKNLLKDPIRNRKEIEETERKLGDDFTRMIDALPISEQEKKEKLATYETLSKQIYTASNSEGIDEATLQAAAASKALDELKAVVKADAESVKTNVSVKSAQFFAEVVPDINAGLTAFLSPDGNPVYLDRAMVTGYLNNLEDGTLVGFRLEIRSEKKEYLYKEGKYLEKTTGKIYEPIKLPSNGNIEVMLVIKKECSIDLYKVNVAYPNTAKTIPSISSGRLFQRVKIAGCRDRLDRFFAEKGAAYTSMLEKLYAITTYFKKCDIGDWKPYEGGIIPYCFWQNSNTGKEAFYTGFDIPYRVGIIDGAYGQVKGLAELRDQLEKVIYAYAIGAMDCDSLLNDVDDYHILLDGIKKLSKEKGILSYVEKSFKEYKAKGIAEHVRECTESQRIIEETSQTIDRLYEIVAEDAKLVKVAITVAQQLGSYVDRISGNDELARYEKGKLTTEILALFIGTEEVNAAKKMTEFERFLARAAMQDVEKVGAKVAERTANDLTKITVEVVGKYDWGLVKKYFNFIQELTGRPVLAKQAEELKSALRLKEYTKLGTEDYANHVKKFNSAKKEALIKEWELQTGQLWPTFKVGEEVYSKNGTLLRKAGDKYDAHHIIEQNYGGEHKWWNMHPAKFPDEHQAGIHGSSSPARELFK